MFIPQGRTWGCSWRCFSASCRSFSRTKRNRELSGALPTQGRSFCRAWRRRVMAGSSWQRCRRSLRQKRVTFSMCWRTWPIHCRRSRARKTAGDPPGRPYEGGNGKLGKQISGRKRCTALGDPAGRPRSRAATGIHRCDYRTIQIVDGQTHQCASRYGWGGRLAAQLSRARCS
jgi:hypothetical protein